MARMFESIQHLKGVVAAFAIGVIGIVVGSEILEIGAEVGIGKLVVLD